MSKMYNECMARIMRDSYRTLISIENVRAYSLREYKSVLRMFIRSLASMCMDAGIHYTKLSYADLKALDETKFDEDVARQLCNDTAVREWININYPEIQLDEIYKTVKKDNLLIHAAIASIVDNSKTKEYTDRVYTTLVRNGFADCMDTYNLAKQLHLQYGNDAITYAEDMYPGDMENR